MCVFYVVYCDDVVVFWYCVVGVVVVGFDFYDDVLFCDLLCVIVVVCCCYVVCVVFVY